MLNANSNAANAKPGVAPWDRPRFERCVWWTVVLLLIGLRLFLSGRDEIVPMNADCANYAQLSQYYLTGDPTRDRFPAQRPGLGLIAQGMALIGVPYKLALDGLLIVTTVAAAWLIRTACHSLGLGLLSLAALLLNPWFINRSRIFMSEPITALLLLLLVVSVAPLFLRRISRWRITTAIGAGMLGAVYLLTRPETPVLLGFWLIVWCSLLVFHWRSIRTASRWWLLKSTLIVAIPLLIALGVTSGWKKLHLRSYGVEALCCTEASGETALLNALYSIPPDELIRYAPVTRQSLARACEVSPTFNQHREKLLDVRQINYGHAKRHLNLDDQVGTWLNWHLDSCFGGNHDRSNEEMLQAATEISQAQHDGRLGYRRALFPIDPLWNLWLPELPDKMLSSLKFSFLPNLKTASDEKLFNQRKCTAIQQGYFDDGLLRRRGTRLDKSLRIYGTSRVASSRFKRIRIVDDQKRVLGTANITKAVRGGWEFSLIYEISRPIETDTIFAEFLPPTPENSGDRNAIRLDGRPITIGGGPRSEAWLVTGVAMQDPGSLQRAWQAVNVEHFYTGLWVISGLAFFVGSTKRLSRRHLQQLAGLIVISAGLIGLRMLLYSMIEVWLKWGLHRYTEPNHLVAIFLLILSGFFLGAVGRRYFDRFSRRRPPVVVTT